MGRNVLVTAPREKSEQTLLTVKTQDSMNSPLPVAERQLDVGDSGHEKKKSCGLKQRLIYFVKVPKGDCWWRRAPSISSWIQLVQFCTTLMFSCEGDPRWETWRWTQEATECLSEDFRPRRRNLNKTPETHQQETTRVSQLRTNQAPVEGTGNGRKLVLPSNSAKRMKKGPKSHI